VLQGRTLNAEAGYFAQRYLEKIPFLRPGVPSWVAIAVIFGAVSSTGYLAWFAVAHWGYKDDIRAQEVPVVGAENLKNLWYSPNGELIGYRQEGWKLSLLHWPTANGSAPSIRSFNLDEVTPSDPPTSSASKTAPNQGPFAQNRYEPLPQLSNATILPNKPRPSASAGSTQSASRTTQPLPVAVSQDLSIVAWAWNGKLNWIDVAKEIPAQNKTSALKPVSLSLTHSEEQRPNTNLFHEIDLPVKATPVALTLLASTSLVVQDAGERLLLYDLKSGKLLREIHELTPCVVTVTGDHALFACHSSPLLVMSFSSFPQEEKEFQTQSQGFKDVGLTAFALSPRGLPAAATDQGTVLVWRGLKDTEALQGEAQSSNNQPEEWQSPGVALAVASHGDWVLAGGGFRGIFLLQQGRAPQSVVKDTAGTTLLAPRNMVIDSGTLRSGFLTFATREGAANATLRSVTALNSSGFQIAGGWVGLWILFLVVIPGVQLWIEETRKQRELHLRGELERSLQRVPTSSSETTPIPLPDPPEGLVKACLGGECVAFIGAGVGAQAGLPTWRPLIQTILNEVNTRGLIEVNQLSSLQEAFTDGQTDLVADGLVDALHGQESKLHDFLIRTFVRRDVHMTRIHSLLRLLNLSAVLTTNFDELLDTAFKDRVQGVYTHQDSEKLLEVLSKREFFLLKLYGSLDRPDSVLFAPSQYLEAMARNLLYSRFMEALFSSRTLLFVGASLEGIESYLTGIRFPTSMAQRHFALVAAQGGAWRAKADLLVRRFGIQVLAYTPTPGYPEVEQFVAKLCARVDPQEAQAQKSVRKVSRLRTVTLENIGPFEHMKLDLDRNWTILLGDNAVGKSTILRAIAVGIAGPDTAEFAGRLIKSGREKDGARITLETEEGKLYITEIRVGDKTIVDSRPSRPLEPEGWLALGFPPLRSFSMSPVTELPSRGLQRLTSEDLMPLVRGEIDPRLDKLKSWIIDLDYRDKNQRATSRTFSSYFRLGDVQNQFTRLLDQFFEIIRRLTPGLKLGRVEIDADKKEVRVETDDGMVRIEFVSQGTQSLLGWVGVLLQRLNDFYGGESQARQTPSGETASSLLDQYALVLMDEIDAHMHPKWQQLLVQSLKGLFPNAQFIVTTHSPLIVGGLERREVRVVRRAGPDEPQAGHVVVEWPKQKLKGLRADQILTGDSLFNLDSTLAPDLYAGRQRYTTLAAKDGLSPEEQRELETLADSLQIRLPAPYEREVARQAFENMQDALEQQLTNLPPEKRKKVMEEAKVQTQENITGSRRP
jgi:hypothetical protein